ncbi:unnamed protein product [Meganyctiphanes norvegica]|uniref:dolichyl-phosphate-mannose--protein mannosyltransferase n=1 Tax=Meganyctiphanes norvegica TaxID=48144 RepID=A0AAV2PP11_MEGNR
MKNEMWQQILRSSPHKRRRSPTSSSSNSSTRRSSPTSSWSTSSAFSTEPRRRHSSNIEQKDQDASTSTTWLYLTVWLASVSLYCNALGGDFVHDDISVIKTNPDVLGKTALYQLFLNDYWGKPLIDPTSHKSYRPFTILTFRMNHIVCGLQPVGYHVVNVGLHSAVCLLLTRLLLHLLHLPPATALLPALIFAAHPIHTEAVTGLVGRADLLAAITLLASLLTYHSAMENMRKKCYIKSEEDVSDETLSVMNSSSRSSHVSGLQTVVVLVAVGTLCKETALTGIAVCAAWDIICHRKHIRRLLNYQVYSKPLFNLLSRLIYLAIASIFLLSIRLLLLRGSPPVFSDQDNPAAAQSDPYCRFLTWLYLPVFNMWLMLCPWVLSHDWQLGSLPLVTSVYDPRNIASLAFYVTLIAITITGITNEKSKGHMTLLGISLLVLPFFPASNLFFTVGFVLAERILYIPSMGYCLLLGVGIGRLGRWRAPLVLLLLGLFSCRTLLRNTDWCSRETLFRAGLSSLPENAKMHYNFANLQKDQGNIELAVHHYQEAIRLWPGHSSAHNNLGTLMNDTNLAEHHFTQALSIHPQHVHAHFNLANLKKEQGRRQETQDLLERCLRIDPLHRDAVQVLAGLYMEQGRGREAEDLHLTLLAARSDDPISHHNYADFLQKNGRSDAALRHYEAALSLDPSLTATLLNTAALLRTSNRTSQAEYLYKRSLSQAWDADVCESLGKLYLTESRLGEAEEAFVTLLNHQPHRVSARLYLGRVKLQQHSYVESEALLRQVLLEEPNHHEGAYQLSILYGYTNRSDLSLELAQQATQNCSQPARLCAKLHAHYGDLLNDRQHTEAAHQQYLLAVSLEPGLTHAHVNLGALQHSQGLYSSAWQHYLTALQQEPSNSLLLENMDMLRRAQQSLHSIHSTPYHNCCTNS